MIIITEIIIIGGSNDVGIAVDGSLLSARLRNSKSAGHTVNAGQWFKFHAGVKAWFRTGLNGSAISVSSYTIE